MKRDEHLTDRPYDWQDRVVVRATIIAGLFCLYIVFWGPLP